MTSMPIPWAPAPLRPTALIRVGVGRLRLAVQGGQLTPAAAIGYALVAAALLLWQFEWLAVPAWLALLWVGGRLGWAARGGTGR